MGQINQNQLVKQMIDFNRTAFVNAFSTTNMLQERTEKAVNSLSRSSRMAAQGGTNGRPNENG